jgi:hypothetical protein
MLPILFTKEMEFLRRYGPQGTSTVARSRSVFPRFFPASFKHIMTNTQNNHKLKYICAYTFISMYYMYLYVYMYMCIEKSFSHILLEDRETL